MSNGSSPTVSILIVNYNRAKLLKDCLESLTAVRETRFEIVVVDNGSRDDSLEVLQQYPAIRVVRSDANRGFAGGNNLGLPHCGGKYVLLLNNDTLVQPDFLQPLVAYLDCHPQVGVAQGKMIVPQWGSRLDACGSFLTAFGLPYHYGYQKEDGPKYQVAYPVFSAKGACLLFRRDLIPQVGGFLFEEDFFCYYEESDFCHRVWLAGFEVHFVPSPPIKHLQGGTAGNTQSDFVLKYYLRNMTFSLAGNLNGPARWQILPGYFLILTLSGVAALLKGRGKLFLAHFEALFWGWKKRNFIRRRRQLVCNLRKQSDREILSRAKKTPRLSYFLKTLTGQLFQYDD